jgi:hypothetical protein
MVDFSMVFCKRLPVGNPSGGNKNADPHGSIGSPAKKMSRCFCHVDLSFLVPTTYDLKKKATCHLDLSKQGTLFKAWLI